MYTDKLVRVLVVDDNAEFRRLTSRLIKSIDSSIQVETESDPIMAIRRIENEKFHVLVTDVYMPMMNGLELTESVREVDLDLPVVLQTGSPSDAIATRAVELGVYAYCIKPPDGQVLVDHIREAAFCYKIASLKRHIAELSGTVDTRPGDLVGLRRTFNETLETLRLAFQPVLAVESGQVIGYEVFIRSSNQRLPNAMSVVDAAVVLEDTEALLMAIIKEVEQCGFPEDKRLFLNILPQDIPVLADVLESGRLSVMRDRLTFDVSERSRLERVVHVDESVLKLKEFGTTFAIDNFGVGIAGTVNFAALKPEYVKVDHEVVGTLASSEKSRAIAAAIIDTCHDSGIKVIAEGVEDPITLKVCTGMSFDYLQGHHFDPPSFDFTEPVIQETA